MLGWKYEHCNGGGDSRRHQLQIDPKIGRQCYLLKRHVNCKKLHTRHQSNRCLGVNAFDKDTIAMFFFFVECAFCYTPMPLNLMVILCEICFYMHILYGVCWLRIGKTNKYIIVIAFRPTNVGDVLTKVVRNVFFWHVLLVYEHTHEM